MKMHEFRTATQHVDDDTELSVQFDREDGLMVLKEVSEVTLSTIFKGRDVPVVVLHL